MCTNFLIDLSSPKAKALSIPAPLISSESFKNKVAKESLGVIEGRTLEFALRLNTELMFRPKDYQFNQNTKDEDRETLLSKLPSMHADAFEHIKYQDNLNLTSWNGKYSFVGMAPIGTGLASHGMNQHGLSIGDMTLNATEYQSHTDEDLVKCNTKIILYVNLVNYVLSNFKNCEEVCHAFTTKKDEYRIINPFYSDDEKEHPFPTAFLFHFPVHDSYGNSLVLEFIKGQVNVYDNTQVGVLTNDPQLPWQIENLTCYIGVTPTNAMPFKGNQFVINNKSQGTGYSSMPGSSTPPDRFIRAALMNNQIFKPKVNCAKALTTQDDSDKMSDELTNMAYHLLNTVDIPNGTSREHSDTISPEQENSDYTLWGVAANLTSRIYNVRMYHSPQVFSIDLRKLIEANTEAFEQQLPQDIYTHSLTEEHIVNVQNESADNIEKIA